MADLPLDQAVARFQGNEQRINTFVNAPNGEQDYETDGGALVPTLPKLLPAVIAQADRATEQALQALAARDDTVLNALIADDIADGLSKTDPDGTDGIPRHFKIFAPDQAQAFIYYRHDAGGVATEIKRYPSVAGIEPLIPIGRHSYDSAYLFYKHLSDRLETLTDSTGQSHIYSRQSPEVGSLIYASNVGSITPVFSALDYDQVLSFPFKSYPDHAKVKIDSDGAMRLIEVFGERYAGPNTFGAQAGSSPEPPPPVDLAPPQQFVVFLVAGQSNAQGRGTASQSPTVPPGFGYWWDDDTDQLRHLADPVEGATSGSAWPAFANEFTARTGLGVIIVPSAIGGTGQTAAAAAETGVLHWDVSGTLVDRALLRLSNAIAHLEEGSFAYQSGGVLWCQGERDASALSSGALSNVGFYNTAFESMLSRFRAAAGSEQMPFLISRIGYRTSGADTASYKALQTAQANFAKQHKGVHLAYTGAQNFVDRDLMIDEYHYRQAGYNEMGRMLAVTAATVCLGRN